MGTRNLTMVIQNRETKVAQYGQFDGYPGGQGLTILNFLQKCDLGNFRDKISKVSFLTEDDINLIDSYNLDNSEYIKRYPHLNRNVAGEILEMVYDGKCDKLYDDEDFASDGLSCEWVYVIDLDKNLLEIYSSGNKIYKLTDNDRFGKYGGPDQYGYYPPTIVGFYDLNNLPSEDIFLSDLDDESGDIFLKCRRDDQLSKII